MSDALDPLAIARQPMQRRALKRFDKILSESEVLLQKEGLGGFSIPALAERLGYTRGSIYAYFPTHYAILNELAARYLAEMEKGFLASAKELARMDLWEVIGAVVDQAVAFYARHPVAGLVILGGAVTDDSFRAQELTIHRLGELGRQLWQQKGFTAPRTPVDVATLAVELGVACMRRSYFEHGKVTKPYRDAAVTAMSAFLSAQVLDAEGKRPHWSKAK